MTNPDSPDTTEPRTDTQSAPSLTDTQPSSTQDDLLTTLQALPRRVWLLPLALLTIFGTWATVSVPFIGMSESIAGIDTDSGKLMLVVLGVIAAAELIPLKRPRVKQCWLYGGIAYTLIALLSLWHIRSEFQSAQAELTGNPFASGVNMEIGLALYVTVLLGIGMAYLGYTMTRTVVPARERL